MIIPHYYEDPHSLHVGTMPNRAYYIPASRRSDALVEHRETSDCFQLLNGSWKFRYYASIYDLQDAFYEVGYDASAFDSIPVPSVWQNHGYDHHQYTNIRYPFPADPPYVPKENPCGAYLYDFTYQKDAAAPRAFLNFEGVASCFYVWLNGQFVGYSQVAHSTSEFDVTKFLQDGTNHLAVLVLKWCDGSYMEDQDMFRIFFGSMIDRTHSKLGKARPWMLYGYIGCAITLVGIFAIPMGMSEFAKYAWFLICYTLLNAVFYTANNIAYSALTALVTKNGAERVEMGSYRFMFAFATSLAIQSVTLLAVSALGDTAEAWRTVAIVYAIIGLIVNTLSVFSVKELPEEELVDTSVKAEIEKDEKYSLVEAAKLLGSNKYYLMICVTYILQQIYGAMISMGTYYTAHILGDKNLFGVFSWAINIPLIIALVFTPTLVAKMHGMYKLNVGSYALATVARALVAVAGYTGSGDVKMMLLFTAIAALGQGPWQGDMNAVIASCSEFTWLTKHKRVDGTMYSCTSLGVKLGGGLGTAITGWLLAFSHYDKALAVQPESCINMLKLMYLVIPFVLDAIITVILSRMKVEEANDKIRAEMKN